MSDPNVKRFLLMPIPAKEGDRFFQCCENCDNLLQAGFFAISITIVYQTYEANLFLGSQVECPICKETNQIIMLIDDEEELDAELQLLKQEIVANKGLLERVIIPDVSEKDLKEIFDE